MDEASTTRARALVAIEGMVGGDGKSIAEAARLLGISVEQALADASTRAAEIRSLLLTLSDRPVRGLGPGGTPDDESNLREFYEAVLANLNRAIEATKRAKPS